MTCYEKFGYNITPEVQIVWKISGGHCYCGNTEIVEFRKSSFKMKNWKNILRDLNSEPP